ncbi:MAG: asparagine--tRNA ligase [Candidatus Delongbacteria bacterium]|nr:asparagine--tRNA ligase [Candidatus Delongbacteria bacterium]
MRYLSIKQCFENQPVDERITIKGWVRTRRDSKGGFSFIELNDGSGIRNLQIIAENNLENYESEIIRINTGDSLVVEGLLSASPGSKQSIELKADRIEVMGKADPDEFPLQKKKHSFEYLREIAHLRPRSNTFGAVFRLRHHICFAIHQFFNQEGFFYIHTPIITGSDCEGAGEMFHVTTLDLNHIPLTLEGKVDYSQDFFQKPANLTVSGQLEAEILATALGKVYTFGPTFRAENSNTTRHLAEFWMVEPEMAFCEIRDNMDLAERFLQYVLRYIMQHASDELEFFNQFIEPGLIRKIENVIDSPFQRITYTEAVKILKDSGRNFEFPADWGCDFQSEHERFITEEIFKKPVIVTDYPKSIKAFYMKLNPDRETVRAMDILVPGIGEIIGGSQREENLDVLIDRIRDMKLEPKDYWWYLELRKFGTVPHSGFGLGLERLLLFSTGMKNIRDVIPFFRTPGNLEF